MPVHKVTDFLSEISAFYKRWCAQCNVFHYGRDKWLKMTESSLFGMMSFIECARSQSLGLFRYANIISFLLVCHLRQRPNKREPFQRARTASERSSRMSYIPAAAADPCFWTLPRFSARKSISRLITLPESIWFCTTLVLRSSTLLSETPCSHSNDNPPIPNKWRYFWNIIQKIGDIFGIDS